MFIQVRVGIKVQENCGFVQSCKRIFFSPQNLKNCEKALSLKYLLNYPYT